MSTALGSVIMRGTHAARPAAATAGRLYYETDTTSLFRDSGSAWESASATASGLTNPMTTTGDIIVSADNSGTPDRLGVGAAGKFLSGGSTPAWGQGPLTTTGDLLIGATGGTPTRLAVDSSTAKALMGGTTPGYAFPMGQKFTTGTSMPGSPSTSDLVWRTDLGLLCYYDGTRWLTVTEYREPNPFSNITPLSASDTYWWPFWDTSYDIYLIACDILALSSSLSGSAYWTFKLFPRNQANTDGSQIGSTTSLQSETNANWLWKSITAINTAFSASTYRQFNLQVTKVSSPGPVYALSALRYRLVVT